MKMTLDLLQEVIHFLQSASMIIQIVSAALSFFVILFVFRFMIPAMWMHIQFNSVIRRLRRIKRTKGGDIASVFERNKTLHHLWTEYEHTIHKQYAQTFRQSDSDQSPSAEVILRSTVPASTIFTTEALVDSRLSTEFFKHLPGLFTGIGIIGTFSGLIQGLRAFKVSENATEVRTSLEVLMHGVSEAFLVSAVAIAAAMVATVLERWLIAGLYRKAEAITFEIDGMFQSGVGEEYLERLVNATEETVDQSKILKDALVTDLANILSTLSERQIQAQIRGNQELGQQIVEGIREGVRAPFDRTAQENSQAVTTLLTDVFAGFSQRLEELFGSQIGGINKLQQQTIESLMNAVAKLDQMASHLDEAGTKSSETMAQKLAETMTSMEERQKVMNDRMAEFVDQIRSLVREEQSETSRKMQSTLAEIGEAVRLQIAAIDEAGDQAAHSHSEREGRMAAQADETVAKLASMTEGIMTEIRALTGEIRQTTDAMRTTTSEAVSRMSNGAATLSRAAEDFRKAGESVAGVLQQTVGVSGHLNQAAGSLSSSSAVLKGVIDDHALAREALAAMVADLRGTIENAKREASLTSDILARIESSAQKLGDAQNDAEHYLDGVTKVLTEAHGEFSEGLKKVLGEGYIEFYSQLSRATALLRTAIEELATTVEIIPPTRTKPATERVL